MGMTDDQGGGEYTGTQFIAVLPDLYEWKAAGWTAATVDLIGTSAWSVTSFRAAALPFREQSTDRRAYRWVIIGDVPGSASGAWKVRATYNGVSVITKAVASAASPAVGSLSLSSGTFTHAPSGSGLFWLLGIWTDASSNYVLGWKQIGSGESTTADSDAIWRPTGLTSSPWKAVVVEVAGFASTEAEKNCMAIRMATNTA